MLSYSTKRSAIIRFFFFHESWGGGGDILILRFIIFLLHELYGVLWWWVLKSTVCGSLTTCFYICAYVVDLVIFGNSSAVHPSSGWVLDCYPSYSLYLVSSIQLYPVLLRGVPVVAGGAFTLYAYYGMSVISDSFLVFWSSSSSSCRLRGLSANITTRGYVKGFSVDFIVLILAIFIHWWLAALQACVSLPPFRWLPFRLG